MIFNSNTSVEYSAVMVKTKNTNVTNFAMASKGRSSDFTGLAIARLVEHTIHLRVITVIHAV
jgi:hypothetical protein